MLTTTPSGETGLFSPFSPKDLVSRLGTSEDMVRTFLRKNYSEVHTKKKLWSIRPEHARQIESDYKNMVQPREAERKLRIEKELAGEPE
jgi:hypothetical protein